MACNAAVVHDPSQDLRCALDMTSATETFCLYCISEQLPSNVRHQGSKQACMQMHRSITFPMTRRLDCVNRVRSSEGLLDLLSR